MLFRYLGATNAKAAASGAVNFLPCFATIRIGKGTASCAHTAWLGIAPAGDNFLHTGLYLTGIALRCFQGGRSKNPVGRRIGMAVGHAHIGWRCGDCVALPIKTVRGNHDIFEFVAIGTRIHPQATTNATRNANQEFQTRKANLCRIACNLGIKCTGLCGDDTAFVTDYPQSFGQANHNTGDTAITNQKIRSRANRENRDIQRTGGEKGAKVAGIGWAEDNIGWTANAEPSVTRHRCLFGIVAAHFWETIKQAHWLVSCLVDR